MNIPPCVCELFQIHSSMSMPAKTANCLHSLVALGAIRIDEHGFFCIFLTTPTSRYNTYLNFLINCHMWKSFYSKTSIRRNLLWMELPLPRFCYFLPSFIFPISIVLRMISQWSCLGYSPSTKVYHYFANQQVELYSPLYILSFFQIAYPLVYVYPILIPL